MDNFRHIWLVNFLLFLKKIAAEADPSTPLPKEEKFASGYGYRGGDIPCSKSIFDDISRLEILIGGKRVGNNSPELINEATEICQRLFHGRVMDIGTYRRFVNEFVDDISAIDRQRLIKTLIFR